MGYRGFNNSICSWILYSKGTRIIANGRGTNDLVKSLKALNKVDRAKAIKDGQVIMAYKDLKKVSKGTGLDAHHQVEKRFAKTLGVKGNEV